MTLKQMLSEEIYGNVATVYHRCDKNKLKLIIERTYKNQSHIHFDNYDQGLYTTYNIQSQMGNSAVQKNGSMEHYGKYIIKFAVKGLRNFFFTNKNEYKKFHPNFKGSNFLEQQLKDAGAGAETLIEFNKLLTKDHVTIGRFLEKKNYIPTRFKGLQYNGEHDGDCLLIFDYTSVVPLSITDDNGKTWIRVQDFIKEQNIQKVNEFKKNKFNNFDKNDLTNKTKEHNFENKFHIIKDTLYIDRDISDLEDIKRISSLYNKNLKINPKVKRIALKYTDFRNAVFDNLERLSLKECTFENLTINNYINDFSAVDCEVTNFHYNLNSFDMLFNMQSSFRIDNLYIKSECFNDEEESIDDEFINLDFHDIQDLLKSLKIKNLYILGKNINKENLETATRGTEIKVHNLAEEKIFNY